jgi:cytidine deaminase
MPEFLKIDTSIKVLSKNELNEYQCLLVDKAKQAATQAYAPYSGFQVGAALLLKTGEIITGNNQENSSYPAGLCAERVAIFTASAQNPQAEFRAIAICAKKSNLNQFVSITPCGSCRQVMSEYEEKQNTPIEIIMMAEGDKYYLSHSVDNLLPFKFSPKHLI